MSIIVRYELCLPIIEPDRADVVFANEPEIQSWPVALGGYSLGGVVTAIHIQEVGACRANITGLAMWASYPSSTHGMSGRVDLSNSSAAIWGTLDCRTTPGDIEDNRRYLPLDTADRPITGGNHSQFGNYGFRACDGGGPDYTESTGPTHHRGHNSVCPSTNDGTHQKGQEAIQKVVNIRMLMAFNN